jgi:DNA helicase-2/ATP-dependent DNA helicase PcrA
MVKECFYYEDEVRYVTDEILSLLGKGYKPTDIAVLYRNSALSRNFELSFIEHKIPYRIYGGFSYLKRKEIKDVMSYLGILSQQNE